MPQIAIKNMSFYYDDFYYQVFNNISIEFDTDWKMGLIGRNGRGKTTLLKLLSGELHATEGSIQGMEHVYYFPYAWKGDYQNVLDAVKENAGGYKSMELAMEELLSVGEEREENQRSMEQYCEVQQRYYESGGYDLTSRIQRETEEMGLDQSLLEREFATLSGGEKTCIQIIALFLRKDGYILLDEPTNHLDSEKKKKLEAYLNKKKGYLLVSHDMEFLDGVIDHILSINKTDITLEQGNYTTWKQNVLYRETYELHRRERLEREIGQLERQAETTRRWSGIGNKQKYEFACHARTNGTRAYMRQAKRAEETVQQNLKEKKQLLTKLEAERPLLLEQQKNTSHCLVTADDVSFCYEKDKWLFKNLSFRIYKGERIWLKGKNGAGKTTLCKLLCREIPCDAIHLSPGVNVTIVSQEPVFLQGSVRELFQKEGYSSSSVHRTGEKPDADDRMRRYRKFLELCYLFELPKGYENRPLETLSSGELKKIDAAWALSEENHLLIFDEPFNYMDANFRDQLMSAIRASSATILFIEHNERIQEVATKIIELDGKDSQKKTEGGSMKIIKDFKTDAILRNSFNQLAKKTFGIDFEDWYQNGFWRDTYQPYAVAEGDRIIANVSVNHMTMELDGQIRNLIQLGTVMTDEQYRGRGCSRMLMEEIMKDFEGKQDGMYLFANDSVLDFYPRFGFVKSEEFVCTESISVESSSKEQVSSDKNSMGKDSFREASMKRIAMKDKEDWQRLEKIITESKIHARFEMRNNPGLWMFYVSKFMQENVYYDKSFDTYAIAEEEGEELILHAFFSKEERDVRQVINAFGSSKKKVTLGFTPVSQDGFEVAKLWEENTTLFIKGMNADWFSEQRIRFPALSHA